MHNDLNLFALYPTTSILSQEQKYLNKLHDDGRETKIDMVPADNIHSRIERRPDTLESILFDAEAQKLSGPALVGFVVSEVKARVPA